MTFGSDAIRHNSAAGGGHSAEIFVLAVTDPRHFFDKGGLVFVLVRVDVAEWEGVVTVGLSGIVEGSEMLCVEGMKVWQVRKNINNESHIFPLSDDTKR